MFNTNHEPLVVSADLSEAIYYGAFEILGPFELGELLKKTGFLAVHLQGEGCNGLASSEVKDLLDSINQRYGLRTAQGFYLRIGRVSFHYLRRNNPQMILDNSIEKRMQLLEDQIKNELEKETHWLQKNLVCHLRVKKQKGNWIIKVDHSEESPLEINSAIFFFLKGLLQECLEWMDSRHRYVISTLSDPVDKYSYNISIGSQLID